MLLAFLYSSQEAKSQRTRLNKIGMFFMSPVSGGRNILIKINLKYTYKCGNCYIKYKLNTRN